MSKNIKSNPANESSDQLANVTPVSSTGSTNPCDAIIDIIQERGGVPVVLSPSTPSGQPTVTELEEVTQFIRDSRIDFNEYKSLMDSILDCREGESQRVYDKLKEKKMNFDYQDECGNTVIAGNTFLSNEERDIFRNRSLFSNSQSYNILKYATYKFVNIRLGLDVADIPNMPVLPYVALIESKFNDCNYVSNTTSKRFRPMFAELIWSYWHEEGMLVHTVNAIARRFQNKRVISGRDPLLNLSLDPLRPLNNLIWGYIQDSIHRLTIARRSFEYRHQYGITSFVAGNIKSEAAETRSEFIQAFHNLLYKATQFYREADNLIKVADSFPLLNALREVHQVLSEGAGNQFGDLPMTARIEMMLEQYILSRQEMREFLGTRATVNYDEPWMEKVDAMKALQGWPGPSIAYFHDLAEFGEELLLSIRWITWSHINSREIARQWALTNRDAIQHYIHSYQAVTGVDISAMNMNPSLPDEKAVVPALLIRRKARRDFLIRRR